MRMNKYECGVGIIAAAAVTIIVVMHMSGDRRDVEGGDVMDLADILRAPSRYDGARVTVAGSVQDIDLFLGPPWISFILKSGDLEIYVEGPPTMIDASSNTSFIPSALRPSELKDLLLNNETIVSGIFKYERHYHIIADEIRIRGDEKKIIRLKP